MGRAAAAVAAVAVLAACSGPSPGPMSGSASGDDGDEAFTTEPWGPGSRGGDPGPGLSRHQGSGPPGDEVGVPVLSDPAVLSGDDVAVALTGLTVYSRGAKLEVAVRGTAEAAARFAARHGPLDLSAPGSGAEGDESQGGLRLEVAYPQGRSARALTPVAAGAAGTSSPQLLLLQGGGGELTWDYDLWLWPLPDPGEAPLELVADWPAAGLDRARAELDLDAVVAAGASPIGVWSSEGAQAPLPAAVTDGAAERGDRALEPVLGDEPAPPVLSRRPWAGRPETQIGVGIPFDPVVVVGDAAAVAIRGLTAYRHGAQLTVAVHTHPREADGAEAGRGLAQLGDLSELGVVLPDGATAELVDGGGAHPPEREPDGPVLVPDGGSSRGLVHTSGVWLWPLPEPAEAPLEVVVAWPEQGIERTRVELGVDAAAVTAASQRAVALWPGQGAARDQR